MLHVASTVHETCNQGGWTFATGTRRAPTKSQQEWGKVTPKCLLQQEPGDRKNTKKNVGICIEEGETPLCYVSCEGACYKTIDLQGYRVGHIDLIP